jgi:hypothetical protein
MCFLVWLSAGVIIGFFLAGLCSISAKGDDRYIEGSSDLGRRVENVA